MERDNPLIFDIFTILSHGQMARITRQCGSTFRGEFGELLSVDFHIPEKPLEVVVQLPHHGHRQDKTLSRAGREGGREQGGWE